MCGRYSIVGDPADLAGLFRVEVGTTDLRPRYNAAPGQKLPVVRLDKDGKCELAMLRWGLIPAWADSPAVGHANINAQVETFHRLPAFRAAFRRRRCLVPADGFYKWQVTADGRRPFRFTLRDGGPFAMAGLWERWDRGDESVESFAIIVAVASELVRPFHDRMPVIIPPSSHDEWLRSEGPTIPMALLHFARLPDMVAFPVSRRLNSPEHEGADLIAAHAF
jgi:putative SOS response-associated peptidase YedK